MNKWELIAEYKLIIQKKSELSRKNRDKVELLISRMHREGKVTIQELKIK